MREEQPLPDEIAEAKSNPGRWVYRIAGKFAESEKIPPEAIIGAWKVDDQGKITGEFISNEKYDSKRWPPVP